MMRWTMWMTGLVLALAGFPVWSEAQIPDEYENLEILPEDIGRDELVGVMRGFSLGLGVRCQHCHVAEDPTDFSTFDFAADDRATKQIAREMLRMVEAINERYVAEAVTARDESLPPVEVTCATCHRGQERPLFIEDVFRTTLTDKGVEAAREEYRRLKAEYYGSWVYDFRVRPLLDLGGELSEEGRLDDAVAVLEFTTELEPDLHTTWFGLAQLQARAGRREAAVGSLQKAIQVAPEGAKPSLRRALERLREAGGGGR